MKNIIPKMKEFLKRINLAALYRRSKAMRRASFALALVVAFVTTYFLVLPALTLDLDSATDEPGISIADSGSSDEGDNGSDESENEEDSSDGSDSASDESGSDESSDEGSDSSSDASNEEGSQGGDAGSSGESSDSSSAGEGGSAESGQTEAGSGEEGADIAGGDTAGDSTGDSTGDESTETGAAQDGTGAEGINTEGTNPDGAATDGTAADSTGSAGLITDPTEIAAGAGLENPTVDSVTGAGTDTDEEQKEKDQDEEEDDSDLTELESRVKDILLRVDAEEGVLQEGVNLKAESLDSDDVLKAARDEGIIDDEETEEKNGLKSKVCFGFAFSFRDAEDCCYDLPKEVTVSAWRDADRTEEYLDEDHKSTPGQRLDDFLEVFRNYADGDREALRGYHMIFLDGEDAEKASELGFEDDALCLRADRDLGFAVIYTEEEPMPAQSFEGELDNIRVSVEAPEGALPRGTTMRLAPVESEDILEIVQDAVNTNDVRVKTIEAVDITFYDKDGNEIEPTEGSAVKVSMYSEKIMENEASVVVHVDDEGQAATMDEATVDGETVEFETDQFSVYAIVGTETIEATYLTADGKTLNVRVTFDSREILPQNAVLEVSEVTYEEDPEAYAKRNERLAEALYEEYGNVAITDVRYLNISILYPDENGSGSVQAQKEYEPLYPVDVKINYTEPIDTTNPGEYKDYNDGSTKVIPDIGNHVIGVHYTEDGAEFLETSDENTDAGISETITQTDSFSEYDFGYIYKYEIKDTDYDYNPDAISEMNFDTNLITKAAGSSLLRGAGDAPAHSKTLGDNLDGTHKLSLTVTGDADTDNKTASNANIIIVFDVSNSMVNYKVPVKYGTHGSDNDGQTVFQLYSNTSGTPVTEGYTGTVYRRNGNGWNARYSEYTGQRYSSNIRRADAAEKVIYDFTHALYGYQNQDDPSTPNVDESKNIQTALITFNRTASTAQGWTSTESDITGKVSSTGAANSKKLTNGSGTNWEAALRAANTMIGTADSDPTFVVFITDGQPTQVVGTPSGTYITDGTPYVGARDDAYTVQQACAATGTDSHGALFGIYAYGTEADYLDDMMYFAYNNAVHTENLTEAGDETFSTEGYYNAGDSEALAEAINDIFSKIVKTLGITSVSISDGTTSQVQTTSGEISRLLEVDTGSYEYWLSVNTVDGKFTMKDLVSGADVEYTVTSSGGNVTISWTKGETNYSETYEGTYSAGTARIKWDRATSFYNYAPPSATFTDPRVNWDLTSVGTLLDGVTYEVTFDVFPSQYTLDMIADLKNGYAEYDDLDANVKQYLIKTGNEYTLATNTNATISYTDTRTDDGPQTTGYTNPAPVPETAADTLSLTKDWSNFVDDREKPEELLMHITRDNTDRYELVLNDDDDWHASAYVSYGIMTIHNGVISIKTPGHDFSYSEPPRMEYYWELIAPVIRPMKINNVDALLVKIDESEAPEMTGDNATAVGEDGYTYYKLTIGGKAMYYRADNAVASLHATNHRRSYLQVVKSVQDPKEGDTFDFTIAVTDSNATGGTADNINSDYYVWFSVFDTVGGSIVISDDLATGEGLQRETDTSGDYTGYYYIPSGNAVTIKMQDGYSLRFLNLPTGTTYSISESLDGNYENVSITGQRKYREETEGEGGSTTLVEKSEETGTVDGLGISGTIDCADSRYEIDYTNKRIVTEVSANKAWKNADGTTTAPQGGQVTYTLFADGTATEYQAILDGTADEEPEGVGGYESEGWTATFVNLSKYKRVNGEKVEIKYTIAETTPYPGYTPSTTEPVASGGTITNTQESTSVSANKAWENADGTTTAPEGGRVTYTLYADGTPTSYTVTLDGTLDTVPAGTAGYESEAWKAMFQNLPKYQSGTTAEIVYTIAETTTYPGYTASSTDPVANGSTIKNTQGSIDTYAVKAWKNADGSTTPPEGATVVFTLYADGTATDYTVTLDGTADDTAPLKTGGYESEAWKAAFVKLPKSRIVNGEVVDIVYSIAETTTYPGYTASTTEPVGSGSTITNSQEVTSVSANKAWVNADGTTTAPQGGQVTYTLYADGTATGYTVTLDGTAETEPAAIGGYESEAWKASFVNLPKYQAGTTTEIVYTIAETKTYPGYTASTTDPVASGETISNTQEIISVNALKAWKNADGSTAPPEGAFVIFTLYADGEATEYTTTLDGTVDAAPEVTGGYESEAWKAAFLNLPKYKVVGGTAVEIVYTIAETTTYPGYALSPEEPVASEGTITNTQEPTSVSANKVWKNADGTTTAPEGGQVTYTLYADGTATTYTVTLDGTVDTAPTGTGGYESEAWKAEFVNLPKYKADGTTVIEYTIAETTGYPGYKASTTDPVENGGTITNSQLSAEIKLLKIGDGQTSTTLDGAQFELYSVWKGPDAADNVKAKNISGQEIGTITTEGGGIASIGNLLPGTYYLVETKAPNGYNMLTTAVEIYIQLADSDPGYTVSYKQDGYGSGSSGAGNLSPAEDGTYLITVSNPSGHALPMTGGAGRLPYTLGGLVMLMAALMYGFRMRRRERRLS